MTSQEFSTAFHDLRKPLMSFILRMTASVADAEDIVQDTWMKAQGSISSFRGESSLKTWVFAIAANLAKDHIKARKRWTEDVTDICRQEALGNREFFREAMHIAATSPQGRFEVKEHIAFCYTCISKSLPLEQQVCLYLKEVYAFKMNEIAQIMYISDAMVKYYLHTGRAKMTDIFEGRCSLINKEGACHQCSELNGIFNPKQAMQEATVNIDMVRRAGREKLFDLRMKILEELDPFESDGAALQLHHLEHNRKVMENYSEKIAI